MSELYNYIADTLPDERFSSHVVKYIPARDIMSRLKAPANMTRDISLIPDIDIKFLLSTDGRQPRHIREKIVLTEGAGIFSEKSLLGLCLNGRGPAPEIFINQAAITRKDPSGDLFDEIVWHEYIHAMEGIEDGPLGAIREMPWSYGLQQLMLQSDRHNHHHFKSDSPDTTFAKYQTYLREGTAVQQNVSEIFARIGALFLNKIQITGEAPSPADIAFFKTDDIELDFSTQNRRLYNLCDLKLALSTYSHNANDIFRSFLPEAVSRIAALYGCQPARMTA